MRRNPVRRISLHPMGPHLADEFVAFLVYITFVAIFSTYMIYRVVPTHGSKNPMVYLSICSLVGSVSVMAIKASDLYHVYDVSLILD